MIKYIGNTTTTQESRIRTATRKLNGHAEATHCHQDQDYTAAPNLHSDAATTPQNNDNNPQPNNIITIRQQC